MYKKIIASLILATFCGSALAIEQQQGAFGHIVRMIVNHNADNDEIYITTDDPSPNCNAMTLRTNDPNVSATSYKTIYSFLLASKISGQNIEFYTDLSCNLFRVEF